MFFKRRRPSTAPNSTVKGREAIHTSTVHLADRTANVDAAALSGEHPELFAKWANGDLRPATITRAFDPYAGGGRYALYSSTTFVGTWVDEACGAHEPAVNSWEQGRVYPTWEQLCKLAALTEISLETLLNSPTTPNALSGCIQTAVPFALAQRFHPSIVAATVDAHPEQASLEEMTVALNEAIADINQMVLDGTDPMTLFLNSVIDDTNPTQPPTC